MVVAQTLEVATQAALPMAALEVDLLRPGEKQGLLFAACDRWIHADGLRQVGYGPALGERKRAAIAEVEPAAHVISALPRREGVPRRSPGARIGNQQERRGRGH